MFVRLYMDSVRYRAAMKAPAAKVVWLAHAQAYGRRLATSDRFVRPDL